MPCLEAVQQAEEEAGKEAVAGAATVACVPAAGEAGLWKVLEGSSLFVPD